MLLCMKAIYVVEEETLKDAWGDVVKRSYEVVE